MFSAPTLPHQKENFSAAKVGNFLDILELCVFYGLDTVTIK